MCIRDREGTALPLQGRNTRPRQDLRGRPEGQEEGPLGGSCLLYTSDAADERSSVDLGGRRIIKNKKKD